MHSVALYQYWMILLMKSQINHYLTFTPHKHCFFCFGSLQLEWERVPAGSSHRWRFHTVHRRNGCQEEYSPPAAFWAPQNVLRRRRPDDVPWFWRSRGWDSKFSVQFWLEVKYVTFQGNNASVKSLAPLLWVVSAQMVNLTKFDFYLSLCVSHLFDI